MAVFVTNLKDFNFLLSNDVEVPIKGKHIEALSNPATRLQLQFPSAQNAYPAQAAENKKERPHL